MQEKRRIEDLKAYVDQRLIEIDLRYQQRFEAQQNAIAKSEIASEKRFESVNEFRQVLTDQTNSLMPRSEASQLLSGLSEKINKLENRFEALEGQSSGSRDETQNIRTNTGLWITLAAVIISAVALLIKFK